MTDASSQRRRRPVGVWVVAIYCLLTGSFQLISQALILTRHVKFSGAGTAYLDSVTSLHWVLSLADSAVTVAGAIALFLLRKSAVPLFAVALALNVIATAIWTNWYELLGGFGIVGALAVWAILIAVILYARSLSTKGVLA